MAEEEVDWGMMDDPVDEWRQGEMEEVAAVGDEDVISLGGADDGDGEFLRLFSLSEPFSAKAW